MTRTFSSLGLMIGTIIGAGMFALPHVIARAGFFWGLFHLVLAFCVVTCIHIFYSVVIAATPGKHRLPGYARIHLGAGAERFAFFSAFGGFYGALLVYGILGGMFLSQLFPSFEGGARVFTFLFFAVGAFVLLCNLRHVGELNFFLTFMLIAVVAVFAVLLLPYMEFSNFKIIPDKTAWFLPYGVFLFAFAGASAVPDAAEAFYRGNKAPNGRFRRVLVFSTIIPLLVYLVFITSVVGVSGQATSSDAISGLENFLGKPAILIGSLIGFLAVFTSYLALGLDLKNIFRYDTQTSALAAWVGVITIPPILFLAGINDFVSLIGLVGAIAIGIDGIIILLSALRVCRTGSQCIIGSVSFHPVFPVLLIGALSLGVVYEVFMILSRVLLSV
ncbi:MAG: hypothetical protein A3J55_02885 [Candidatus Ryanbacteria bacterium RIFCSPHIGHO2_02_FULL_45_17b]|uniref:Amino acid transporter transmembrane domain-containing protein n=1 Tax=Candidatus Ryanbacteria bacterium RIFCSPHIGHO2_01_FULL_45_22 TaxID=1802114 RepID=A0A1G2G0Q8_9BACT|nr:MAG: hypothetical protein A2719_05575 [Candidatus Ryanbacteria bacterium RIFCSPHIGHO2_01_FULL_45_22]OGZ47356.1 MAG: hypothetical protein A3J55_02885 [Candidatus Ryanbacteria bacterium RIFCSPHIGHO2_02_FULL_45_17b]